MGSVDKREDGTLWRREQEAAQGTAQGVGRKTEQNAAQGVGRKTEQNAAQEVETEPKGDWKTRKGRRRDRYRLTGSLMAKICAFFLLAVSFFAAMAGTCACVYIGEYGFYSESMDTVMEDALYGHCMRIAYNIIANLEADGGSTEGAEEICEGRNIEVELFLIDERRRETLVWKSGDTENFRLSRDIYIHLDSEVTVNGYHLQPEDNQYLCRVYIDTDFPQDDEFRQLGRLVMQIYDARYLLVAVAVGGVFLCLFSFIFLMCSAGHHNGKKGIVPGVLTDIPLDVLTVLFVGIGLGYLYVLIRFVSEFFWEDFYEIGVMLIGIVLLAVWITFYCMELALRIKLGKFWHNTLIYRIGKGIWYLLRLIGRGIAALVQGVPLIWNILFVFSVICFLEFMGVAWFWGWRGDSFLLWVLEKAILLPILVYISLSFKKLLKASRALAQGQEGYTVDTSWMVGEFKEYGENLNSLSQGISKAVAERMKSERLKTELISNVSHDLKTPLTSIINYADLLCEEINGSGEASEDGVPDREKAAEYAEVLLRQSKRLKKLLEDLLEASKATTGNLEMNLEPCEVGVLFSQTVGEYQQKMEQGGLELIIRQPEEPVKIMADGRRLWRVFDNLLNNICKYAQENTRVYLSMQSKEGQVQIVFRNISKYPLDISGEELEERFVRGDKSRHMEGNGLGLSIAKSLVELQNGRMEIVIDGDLFKVTLCFPEI